jgi:hypothetical protein
MHNLPPARTQADLNRLLDLATGTGLSLLDELTLLRAALRRYLETGDPDEAVAWAAKEISNSVSNYKPPK